MSVGVERAVSRDTEAAAALFNALWPRQHQPDLCRKEERKGHTCAASIVLLCDTGKKEGRGRVPRRQRNQSRLLGQTTTSRDVDIQCLMAGEIQSWPGK